MPGTSWMLSARIYPIRVSLRMKSAWARAGRIRNAVGEAGLLTPR